MNRLMRAQLNAAGRHDVRIDRRDVDLGASTLPPDQACAALRHAIDSFVGGGADFDDLADALRVATVAVRVETKDEAERLRRLGVDYAQGILYGRPASDLVERVSPG